MAPIDRRQHRQQRVRGAGPSSVQASFGFSFGAPAAKTAKQSSLPPQRSSRRTPVLATPRGANGSARRHRSASSQRSSAAKSARTPNGQTPSAALGKRKRGSSQARPAEEDNDEVDELSPERNETVHSIEKSRRVVGTVSPIHEEVDDMPDELSVMENGTSTVRKSGLHAPISMSGTPVSVVDKMSSRNGFVHETPILKRLSNGSRPSQSSTPQSSMRKYTSAKSRATTNGLQPSDVDVETPSAAPRDEESEDELSPLHLIENTPRVVAQSPYVHPATRDPDAMELDELSSPMPSVPVTDSRANESIRAGRRPRQDSTPRTNAVPRRHSNLRQLSEDEDSPSTQSEATQTTPAVRQSKRYVARHTVPHQAEAGEVDELSPQNERVRHSQQVPNPALRVEQSIEEDDGYESEYQEQAVEEETEEPPQVASATPPEARASNPSRKRQRISGPKYSIDVVRMKGMPLRGVTVADTTRTILEEILDKRIGRAHEQMQSAHDSARRKDIRQQINLSISFKESLNEKLLDLQDSNDVLNINLQKLKLLKRDNLGLRKEILTLQSNRQDVALEHDGEQDVYEAEKSRREQRRALSANMFDIEAAIRRGRERAKRDGRDDEGPKMSSSMLLDVVGRQVGSLGGGLLKSATSFNTVLERAASWLEGRS